MLKGKNIAEFCFTIKFSISFLGQAEATHIEQRLLQYHRPSVYNKAHARKEKERRRILFMGNYTKETLTVQ